jgi:predicted  nucleic acid-binding Zn-ribbon protein
MSIAASLRELHHILRLVDDIQARLDHGPRRVKVMEQRLQAVEANHAHLKESIKQTKVLADQKQLHLLEREEHVRGLKIKLNCCNNNREYQTLKGQVAADETANSVQADEILDALERIDALQAELAACEAAKTQSAQELAAAREAVEEQRRRLESELAVKINELKRVEEVLPPGVKEVYHRMVHARGQDALAPIDGDVCSSCSQIVTTQTINQLILGNPVFCKSCGALLYPANDNFPR